MAKPKRQLDDIFVGVILGVVLGILFMAWMVPKTELINTIPAEQQCTDVTVYETTQEFCKPTERKPND